MTAVCSSINGATLVVGQDQRAGTLKHMVDVLKEKALKSDIKVWHQAQPSPLPACFTHTLAGYAVRGHVKPLLTRCFAVPRVTRTSRGSSPAMMLPRLRRRGR